MIVPLTESDLAAVRRQPHLVFSRRPGESVILVIEGRLIELKYERQDHRRVVCGIYAPSDCKILRSEIATRPAAAAA